MRVEHGVLVSGDVCARYGVAIERLVADQLRRDGALMPDGLGELLVDLVTAGRRWREAHQPAAERARIPREAEVVETVSTEQAARRLNITSRAVRARAARGSVPARRGRHGWVFDALDIEALVDSGPLT